jgi:hypothetical protein
LACEKETCFVSDANIDDLLRDFETSLAADDLRAAERWLDQLRARVGAEHTEVLYASARLTWIESGPEAARVLFERAIASDGKHADAHYGLGCVAEELDDRAQMIASFLRVRTLDALRDKELRLVDEQAFQHIEQVAREVLDGLPHVLLARLEHVPILIESRPSRALVNDGFDPRAFGSSRVRSRACQTSPRRRVLCCMPATCSQSSRTSRR